MRSEDILRQEAGTQPADAVHGDAHFEQAASGHKIGHTSSEYKPDERENYCVPNVPKTTENADKQGDSDNLRLGVAGFERFEESPLLFHDSESEGTFRGTRSELVEAWQNLSAVLAGEGVRG